MSMKLLSDMKISTKIIGICLSIIVLFLAAVFVLFLPGVEKDMMNNRKASLKNVVDAAYSVVAAYRDMAEKGELPENEAKAQAMARIKSMRYAGNNYVWINSTDRPFSKMIMHPTAPQLDGKPLDAPKFNCATRMQFGNGGGVVDIPGGDKNLFSAMVEVAERGGEGYVAYDWPRPTADGASTELHPKDSYVKLFRPWGWIIGTGLYVDDVHAQIMELRMQVIWTTLVILALALGLGLAVMRTITKPIGSIVSFADDVASGNLDTAVSGTFGGETGRLKEAIELMVTELKETIGRAEDKTREAAEEAERAQLATREAEEAKQEAEGAMHRGMHQAADRLEEVVVHMTGAAQELMAQVDESARGADYQKERIGETATAMEEMNATVLEVARNASEAAESSDGARNKALQGADVVRQVVAAINTVQEQSFTLKEQMAELGDQAEGIGAIMNVITDIADQTNLLALNAAIEAARAGEAGRGFAVVADEVRKLAEKTMTATKEVGEAIAGIQKGTRANMDGVDRSVGAIEEVTTLAQTSGEALDEIVRFNEVASDQVRSIATASEEQSAASEEINRGIDEINRVALESAEAMTQSAQAVGQLSDQAHVLEEMMHDLKQVEA